MELDLSWLLNVELVSCTWRQAMIDLKIWTKVLHYKATKYEQIISPCYYLTNEWIRLMKTSCGRKYTEDCSTNPHPTFMVNRYATRKCYWRYRTQRRWIIDDLIQTFFTETVRRFWRTIGDLEDTRWPWTITFTKDLTLDSIRLMTSTSYTPEETEWSIDRLWSL